MNKAFFAPFRAPARMAQAAHHGAVPSGRFTLITVLF
jgi:hypothetical protein